ncbi:MAG: 30S ribosomal protein S8 [Elusimicrobiota bacterium]
MASTDPIADMLTCIRNANHRFHEKVDVPASKVKEEVLKLLKDEGYISNYKRIDDTKQGILRVYMKYGANKTRVITAIQRVSKPGLRIYRGSDELPKVRGGIGVALVSTSSGIMSCKKARSMKIGGEILCYIW